MRHILYLTALVMRGNALRLRDATMAARGNHWPAPSYVQTSIVLPKSNEVRGSVMTWKENPKAFSSPNFDVLNLWRNSRLENWESTRQNRLRELAEWRRAATNAVEVTVWVSPIPDNSDLRIQGFHTSIGIRRTSDKSSSELSFSPRGIGYRGEFSPEVDRHYLRWQSHSHSPIPIAVAMITTSLGSQQIAVAIQSHMEKYFQGKKYDLLGYNCNSFSAAVFLYMTNIPLPSAHRVFDWEGRDEKKNLVDLRAGGFLPTLQELEKARAVRWDSVASLLGGISSLFGSGGSMMAPASPGFLASRAGKMQPPKIFLQPRGLDYQKNRPGPWSGSVSHPKAQFESLCHWVVLSFLLC